MGIFRKVKEVGRLVYKNIQKRERDLHGFDFTVQKTIESSEAERRIWGTERNIGNSNIRSFKSSEKIFILGSGPSIRHINSKQWSHIRKHDSVGFNFWFVHDINPTFYFYQTPPREYIKTVLRILSNKESHYSKIPFIIRTVNTDNLSNKQHTILERIISNYNFYTCREIPIHSKCTIKPINLLKFFEDLGLLRYDSVSTIVPKLRSTVGLIVPWAYQMGYKKIVLCGIDFKGNDHFWDYDKYSNIKDKYNLPSPGFANTDTFSDENYSKVTMKDYIVTLSQWAYKNNNVDIKVINEDTALHPEIGVANLFNN
jgi:hypothetical protein